MELLELNMKYDIKKIIKTESKLLPQISYDITKIEFDNVIIDILISIDQLTKQEKEYFKRIKININGIEETYYPDYVTLRELEKIRDSSDLNISDTIVNLDKKTENVNLSLQKSVENISDESKEKSITEKLQNKINKIKDEKNWKTLQPDSKVLQEWNKKPTINLTDFADKKYWVQQLNNTVTEIYDYLKDSFIEFGKELSKELIDYMDRQSHNLDELDNKQKKTIQPKKYDDLVEKEIKQRNHISPIQTILSSVDFFINMYTIALCIGENFIDDIYFVKINGIEIPQPKRNTFQRSACGITIDIPTTDLTIEKLGVLSYPVDAALSCYSKYSGLKSLYEVKPFIGFLYDLNSKPIDLYVTYDTLISSLDKNGDLLFQSEKIVSQKSLDNNNKENKFLSNREGRRVFIFRNVRFMSDNSNDLEYNQSSANVLTGQSKFIFRKIEELEFKN